ncbi:calcium-translocating P-type ATPase, PMCA-type [Candidatus Dependentiae bacterium]|nr:calcium-translocating P-type ATPase, PMCA-type [Candidatus Dependentiae bacterium]
MSKFYKEETSEIFKEFKSNKETGLSSAQALKNLAQFGKNVFKKGRRRSAFQILLSQFKEVMVLILLAAAVLSFIFKEGPEDFDWIIILIIVIFNATLGFIQENKAETSLESLKKHLKLKAKIIRDGELQLIDSSLIVPGDVIFLEAGDKVPADARLFKLRNLSVNESMLTGESLPVYKNIEPITEDAQVADRINMVYMNTLILDGEGYGIITETGQDTEIGQIASLIVDQKETITPLQKKLKQLGNFIIFVCVIISVVVGITMIFLKYPWENGIFIPTVKLAFLTAVSLAVAAIPEGLPAIITIALAIGVQRMVKNKAIIRHLPAVETLGCATIICSDKTGTITKNEMTCIDIGFKDNIIPVSESKQLHLELIKNLVTNCALCNNSNITEDSVIGDPTEVALLKFAEDQGFNFSELRTRNKRLGSAPFNSIRMKMSTINKDEKGKILLYTKGALERVIEDSTHFIDSDGSIKELDSKNRDLILQKNLMMSKDGLRVLGFAFRDLNDNDLKVEDYADLETNLVFQGMLGLLDPPRDDVKEAIARCEAAGITPIMITGDHLKTAENIAKKVGILDPGEISISGTEFAKISHGRYLKMVDNISTYARISPAQKLRIVDTLKSRGNIVAMTGDGINDVPAIKNADIGIAMGKTGTEVTINAADMVLLDDNFSTIVKAVEEGRIIYDNIKKFIQYLISCNLGEVLTIFLSIVISFFLKSFLIPITLVQILWINLLTDGLPAAALSFDRATRDVMKGNPRKPDEKLFSGKLLSSMMKRGIKIALGTLIAFSIGFYYLGADNPLTENINEAFILGSTLAFSTIVFSQLLYVFLIRGKDKLGFKQRVFGNKYLFYAVLISVIAQLSVLLIPALNNFFGTVFPGLEGWIVIIVISILSAFL